MDDGLANLAGAEEGETGHRGCARVDDLRPLAEDPRATRSHCRSAPARVLVEAILILPFSWSRRIFHEKPPERGTETRDHISPTLRTPDGRWYHNREAS